VCVRRQTIHIGRRRAHVGVRPLLAEEVIVVVVVVTVEVVVERTRVGVAGVSGTMGTGKI